MHIFAGAVGTNVDGACRVSEKINAVDNGDDALAVLDACNFDEDGDLASTTVFVDNDEEGEDAEEDKDDDEDDGGETSISKPEDKDPTVDPAGDIEADRMDGFENGGLEKFVPDCEPTCI